MAAEMHQNWSDDSDFRFTLSFAIPRNASRSWSGDVWSSVISTYWKMRSSLSGIENKTHQEIDERLESYGSVLRHKLIVDHIHVTL